MSAYEKVGGFGNFLAMQHSGSMDFKTTVKSMTLFAKEVLPRLKDVGTKSTEFGPLAERGKKAKARPTAQAAE